MILSKEREHGLAITGIILELLAITLVLGNSPNIHLTSSNKVEEPCYFHQYQSTLHHHHYMIYKKLT